MSLYALNFKDRRTYYHFVKAWKHDYNQVSSDIRTLRYEGKAKMRLARDARANQRACIVLAAKATELLNLRIDSKLKAGQQRAVISDPTSNSNRADPSELTD